MILASSNSPTYLPQKEQTSILRLGLENHAINEEIFSAINLLAI